jgi:hypothetical protein
VSGVVPDAGDTIRLIYAAFASAPKPRADCITPHRCGECDEVASRLAPHEAQAVPAEDMYWLGDSLPLLAPEAFRHYLPRFLEFTMTHPDCSAEGLILFNLVPSPTLDVGPRDRFTQFTREEAQAVLAFLSYRASLPDAKHERVDIDAAVAFWSRRAMIHEKT